MNKKHNPPTPPGWEDPDHIPHFPDWPNVPYADWPRTRFHRWNDSECANVVPWNYDCCTPGPGDCVCVTSGDVDRWNSYSGLSGLTAFDPADISAALSAYDDINDKLDNMSGYDDIEYGYAILSANSGIWNSAAYVPNIYENLSALNSGKLDASAMKVWTDSLKATKEFGYYGDFEGTIDGDGSYDRPLRVSKDVATTMAIVMSATNNFNIPLANSDDIDKILKNYWDLSGIWVKTDSLAHQNQDLIEWIINNMKAYSAANMWYHEKVTLEESKQNPDNFYYWEE